MFEHIRSSKIITLFILALSIIGCRQLIPPAPAEDSLLDGPMEGLTSAEKLLFLQGDQAFNDEVFTSSTGLGPRFVASSCGACHAGDGKGHPFTSLIRLGQTVPNTQADFTIGGPQLQNRALPGHEPEVLNSGIPFMIIMPPAITGLGLLAALSDEQILSNADSTDLDNDGISGTPNYPMVPSYFVEKGIHNSSLGIIGRFGKKAAAVDLLHQTVSAYNQDMGITSSFEPFDPSTGLFQEPEIDESTVNQVIMYLRTLKAPIQRNQDDPDVQHGRNLFISINCSSCHIPSWTTGHSDISALSNQTFYPYTDLLLHDMGSNLDDGVTEGSAQTYEWRTPPLWGLGLSPNSQGGTYFLMHDGRARSIDEAIRMHEGEANGSKEKYLELSPDERNNILIFLESL